MSDTPAVLFVCLGNICRSPLAEGVFRHVAAEAGLDVVIDSAGTGGWHAGEPPDPRAIAVARHHGVDIAHLRARQVRTADFARFSHIYAADHANLADLKGLRPAGAGTEPALLLDLVAGREGQALADPWYGDEAGFLDTWNDAMSAARALVARLAQSG